MKKLERNLIDNILESEVKLGCVSTAISFYYPKESLIELLDCSPNELQSAIAEFINNEKNRLGEVTIQELTSEKGRYEIRISSEGFDWVRANFEPSDFMKNFVNEIRKPGNTLESIEALFRRYSSEVEVKEVHDGEWALSFADESIDPYVYHIEQNIFGLEYHRFTKESYLKMMSESE